MLASASPARRRRPTPACRPRLDSPARPQLSQRPGSQHEHQQLRGEVGRTGPEPPARAVRRRAPCGRDSNAGCREMARRSGVVRRVVGELARVCEVGTDASGEDRRAPSCSCPRMGRFGFAWETSQSLRKATRGDNAREWVGFGPPATTELEQDAARDPAVRRSARRRAALARPCAERPARRPRDRRASCRERVS